VKRAGLRSTGLAVTYSPTSWDAVPSAPRRLTAEFGMGSGVSLAAVATKPAERKAGGCGAAGPSALVSRIRRTRLSCPGDAGPRSVDSCPGAGVRLLPDRIEACRAISTGQLNALPRLYLRPIDVVVFHGPQGRPGFEGGFPLRCLQRLSRPHIATLHCRWHDNRSTSGAFTPVLSY
jgi:hypothetical protein